MKQYFTCIIIDDEPNAIELLEDRITELYDNIQILGTYTHWKKALNALREVECDLLFLDISMPQKNGFDLLNLAPGLNTEVIFVTAHADYALKAFAYTVSGYILKPIKDEALTQAIDKAIKRQNNSQLALQQGNPSSVSNSKIGIPLDRGIDYLRVSDILYLESSNRYTKIVSKEKSTLSSYSIGRFKQLLETYSFCQPHRFYLVNPEHMERYDHIGITMSDGKKIPVSPSMKESILKIFETIKRQGNSTGK